MSWLHRLPRDLRLHIASFNSNLRGLRYAAIQELKTTFGGALKLEMDVLYDEEKLLHFHQATVDIVEIRQFLVSDDFHTTQIRQETDYKTTQIRHAINTRICEHVIATQSVALVSYCIDNKLMELWEVVQCWSTNRSITDEYLQAVLNRHPQYPSDTHLINKFKKVRMCTF